MEMNKISKIVEKMSELPKELSPDDNYIVIDAEQLNKILEGNRKRIIEILWEQNPITEEKLSDLLRYDAHKDLTLLNHVGLINIKKIDKESKHDIITLNRKAKVIAS